jgi:hypothetical protein
MQCVAHYSGGLASHLAAFRASEEFGRDNVTLLFADTKSEDADLYRFVGEGSEALRCRLVTVCDGRTIWQVMRDERFLANSRVDPCSRILKREILDRWCAENAPDAVHVIGYTACEGMRFNKLAGKFGGRLRAPLMETPTVSKDQVAGEFSEYFPSIRPPRLYALGAEHNNCGGACVKAGHAHFLWLLKTMPEKYAEWEREEQGMRDFLGRDDVAILKDRRGGLSRPITLRQFRERVENDQALPLFDRSESCMCA